ncbi:DUF3108 domain-containing protein [bacterium]|nr:DUF3108 domain-containing protein [bacterium]
MTDMNIYRKRGFFGNHVFLFLAAGLLLVSHAFSQSKKQQQNECKPNFAVFTEGEELTYEVSYLGMGLGTIRTRVLRVRNGEHGLQVWLEGLIRTYRGVPFVTLNTLYRSRIGGTLASQDFHNKEYLRNDTVYKHIDYDFDSKKDVVYIHETVDDNPYWIRDDTLALEGKHWQDGLSLLFYARAYAHAHCRKKVPVLMYRDKAITTINFGVEREEMDLDAIDREVRTVKLDGETGFTGIFGLTGGFEGWFSEDRAAIPIVAKMHVLIGSVYIELIKWKRPGWSPPLYKD